MTLVVDHDCVRKPCSEVRCTRVTKEDDAGGGGGISRKNKGVCIYSWAVGHALVLCVVCS